MEKLTFKQKMDLYDELIEKRKILTSRIDTFSFEKQETIT